MAEIVVSPDSEKIRYMGRVDFTDPKAPRFDWAGIEISVNFTGSWVDVLLEDGGNDYNVIVDRKHYGVIETKKGVTRYKAVKGLHHGMHTLSIAKRTEGYDGLAVFRGFVIDENSVSSMVPEERPGRILFIGDSLSVGYGVEGKSIKCDSERKYKNNRLSFASVAALELFADYHVIAVSGRGVVRNYNDPKTASDRPLPSYFDNVLFNDDNLKWDHKSWQPDEVVVNLGTNDFSTEPKPSKKDFLDGYNKLIKQIRKNYPHAYIFCCTGPAQQEPFFEYMEEFFKKNKDKKLCRIDMEMMTEKDWGCDYHPNIKAAQRMAEEFMEQRAAFLNKQPKPKKKK